jgi:hypothetical protein
LTLKLYEFREAKSHLIHYSNGDIYCELSEEHLWARFKTASLKRNDKILRDFAIYYNILKYITIYCKMLKDSTRFYKMLQDITKFCKILQDITRYYKTLQDITRYCRILQDITRYYRWLDHEHAAVSSATHCRTVIKPEVVHHVATSLQRVESNRTGGPCGNIWKHLIKLQHTLLLCEFSKYT